MKTNWHGLSIEYRVIPLGGGPGLRPDFETQITEVKLEDEAEFRANHPKGTPAEIVERDEMWIEAHLRKEVEDGED